MLSGIARRAGSAIAETGNSHMELNPCLTPVHPKRKGPAERLEPLRPDHRGDQIDKGQGRYDAGDIDHEVLLNFFAGEEKREAKAEASQTERKSSRKPNGEIHCT